MEFSVIRLVCDTLKHDHIRVCGGVCVYTDRMVWALMCVAPLVTDLDLTQTQCATRMQTPQECQTLQMCVWLIAELP